MNPKKKHIVLTNFYIIGGKNNGGDKIDSKVELRKDNGMLIRTIATGAEDAKFQGDSILVIKDRVCELRNQWGVLIRKV